MGFSDPLAFGFGLFALVVAAFGLGALLGAPYLPVLSRDVQSLLDLAGVKEGETLLDLGCGDGRLLRAAARRGVTGVGYEINPLVWLIAKLLCFPQRELISIRLGNYWAASWPPCDIIYVFLIDRYMPKLDQVLQERLRKTTRVVSYVFKIPGRAAVRSTKNATLYVYSPTTTISGTPRQAK